LIKVESSARTATTDSGAVAEDGNRNSAGQPPALNFARRCGKAKEQQVVASAQSQAIGDFYVDLVNLMTNNPDMSLEEIRDRFEHWGDLTADPGGVDYAEVDAGGVRAMWATPHGCVDDRVLVCLHGGGYVCSSMFSHRKMYGHLAKASGCRALILDFRRAPEFQHPAQVEDAVAAYIWLLGQGYKPEHIATTGDSAGGTLATTMVLAARDAGLPLPAAIMAVSPWVDMEVAGESMKTNLGKDLSMTPESAQAMASMFLGDASPQDPLANPLWADMTGLPPMFLQVGDQELLLDDSVRLAANAKDSGVDVRLDVWAGMQHVHQMMAGRAPEADESIANMADWVRPKLGL
jgi:epsilon-lactone hydrolase